mgnify:CR=1 FL=1
MGVFSLSFPEAVLRLLLALAAGGVIGYGRSKRDRAAGFRTYMLISLGSAMSVLISLYEYLMLQGPWLEDALEAGSKFDASRMAAQLIAGIGFLGAGIIIKTSHQQVKGLTTATGLFAAVCLGIAAGIGYYALVAVTMAVVVLVLNVMSPLEASFKRRLRNITLSVEFNRLEDIDLISQTIEAEEARIYDIDIERTEKKNGTFPSAIFILQLSRQHHSHSGMLSTLAELPCVNSVQEVIA